MLTEPITGPRAWTRATLDDSTAWYYLLPERLLAALEQTVLELRQRPRPVTSLGWADFPGADLAQTLRPVVDVLQAGRGFVILDGLPPLRHALPELQALYWLLGQLLGKPVAQDVEGTLLYDVRDTGKDLAQGARFSVTNYESSFHTDSSFGEGVDYVGLLCLYTAKSGGLNQVVSGYAVHNRLLAEHAGVLPILYEPFYIDRRGGTRAGDATTVRRPVLEWDSHGLTIRYLRYWIQAGHDKAGRPLTAAQVKALDALDSVLGQRDLAAEFMLQPGQMFFINNRWVLHNRTAFEDYPETERRRHYVRLWLHA